MGPNTTRVTLRTWLAFLLGLSTAVVALSPSAVADDEQLSTARRVIERRMAQTMVESEQPRLSADEVVLLREILTQSAVDRERLTVRGAVVSLCLAHRANVPLSSVQTLILERLNVEGAVDLRSHDYPLHLAMVECTITGGLQLADSRLRALTLVGPGRIEGVAASGLGLTQSLEIRDVTLGQLDLAGASVGGGVQLTNVEVGGERGQPIAISADDLKVGRALNFEGVSVRGPVHLRGAEVRGQIALVGTQMIPRATPGGFSISLQSAECADFVLRGSREEGTGGAGAVTPSRIGPVDATNMRVRGRLYFADCVVQVGRVPDQADHDELDGSPPPSAPGSAAKGRRAIQTVFQADGLRAGRVILSHLVLPGLVRFLSARVSRALTWRFVESPGTTHLDLSRAQVGSLKFHTPSIPASVGLAGLEYEQLLSMEAAEQSVPCDLPVLLRLLKLQPKYQPQPYQHAAGVLREQGRIADARAVLIAKEDERAAGPMGGFTRVKHWVLGVLIGYGHDPWRAFKIGLAVILLGALVFTWARRSGLMVPRATDAPRDSGGSLIDGWKQHHTRFLALAYSLDVFVPLVNLRQADHWQPDAHKGKLLVLGRRNKVFRIVLRKGQLVRLWAWFQHFAGWVLTTLLAAGVTGLIRT